MRAARPVPRDELDAHLDQWRDAGILTAAQAGEIRRYERGDRAGAGRLRLGSEAAALLGGSLALIAATVLVSRFWGELETWARLAVVAAATAWLLAAGALVRGDGHAPTRVTALAWLLASAGIALLAGLVATEVFTLAVPEVAIAAGGAAAVPSWILWRRCPSALQQLAVLAALASMVAGTVGRMEGRGSPAIGAALWALALAWLLMAWSGMLVQPGAGYALGGALMVVATRVIAVREPALGDALGVVSALGLVALSVPLRSLSLLGMAMGGVLITVPLLVARHFADALAAPVVLTVVSAVLLLGALAAGRTGAPRQARKPRRSVALVAVAIVAMTGVAVTTVAGARRVPSFPRIAGVDATGDVAFVRADGERGCVVVVPAAGGTQRVVRCQEGFAAMPGALRWTEGGDLAVALYWGPGAPARLIVDAGTGAVKAHMPTTWLAPHGSERVVRGDTTAVLVNEGGTAEVALETPTGSRAVVARAEGPDGYRFEDVAWSPDGRWLLVVDSEERILLVDAAGDREPMVLADSGGAPVWRG